MGHGSTRGFGFLGVSDLKRLRGSRVARVQGVVGVSGFRGLGFRGLGVRGCRVSFVPVLYVFPHVSIG